MKSVLDLWGLETILDPALDNEIEDDAFFQMAAEQNGFSMLKTACDFELLNSLNLPAVIAVRMAQGFSPGFLTLNAIDGRDVTLGRTGKNAVITVPEDVVAAHCYGPVYIPWRNHLDDIDPMAHGQSDASVVKLKNYLREIGYAQIGVGSHYDDQTEWAVQHLQEKNGLPPDGIVGPLTKILLFNENPALNIPHIRRGAETQ